MWSARRARSGSEGYLAYDFGEHPLNPVRLDLTIRLARELGVLDQLDVVCPGRRRRGRAAHRPRRRLPRRGPRRRARIRRSRGYGLGTDDDPVFAGMYDASALIAGGSAIAARQVWDGTVAHAVNIAGGLHHAMRRLCVRVLRLQRRRPRHPRRMLAAGATKVAYVDIDVHHGDGVQAAFYDDPRVLTISLHQDPRTLFPGTGMPTEIGTGAAEGTSVNVALPPGTGDDGWLRAFRAVVPGAVRAFAPDVLVTQCGCDTHHEDPLANLQLTVDGQRTAIAELHALAHEAAGGKWVAFGGGGYGLVRCVPRTWTHLLAEATGNPVAPEHAGARRHGSRTCARAACAANCRRRWARDATPHVEPWMPGGDSWLDRSDRRDPARGVPAARPRPGRSP